MPTPSVINQFRYSDSINRRYWDENYWFDTFQVQPVTSAVGGGAATGTAGDNNVLFTQFGQYEWNVIGTQETLAPSLDAFGLNLVQDVESTSGIELCTGQTLLSPNTFTVGGPAFFFQCVFSVATVAGVDPLIIGLRKVQAFDATLANYTDFAAIGLSGGAGDIEMLTQVDTGGVTTTDSTQDATDGDVMQFAIRVDSSGNVTYQYNYLPPTVVAAFQFEAGDILIPFIRSTQSATTTTQASCNYFEIGFQS